MTERTIARVHVCVPVQGGSLTLERVAAGWLVMLDCPRACQFTGVQRRLDFGQKVSHVCEAHECMPPLPIDQPLPDVIETVQADQLQAFASRGLSAQPPAPVAQKGSSR